MAAQQDPALRAALRTFPVPHPIVECLDQLLAVLVDEELRILHPGLRRGYRVRISGVADNFQRHTLLMGALIGDPAAGWLPGPRPDPRVVAAARDQPVDPAAATVTGAFNRFHWPGLRPDGTLATGLDAHDLWIWGEGTPADMDAIHFRGLAIQLPNGRSRSTDSADHRHGYQNICASLFSVQPPKVNGFL